MVGVHVAEGDVAGGGVDVFGALHGAEYAGAAVEEEVGGGRGCVADDVSRCGAIGSFDASGASQHYQFHKLSFCHEAVANVRKGDHRCVGGRPFFRRTSQDWLVR